jgi:FemAB-related protein (PEP-CTERM system-associated)
MALAPVMEEPRLTVRPLQPADEPKWDAFVRAQPEGSPFHLIAWKRTLEQVFGYKPMYLVAEAEGQIKGVLPLFEIRNLVVGHVLISTPFATEGGILADSPEARRAIVAELKSAAHRLRVDYVELRNTWEGQCAGFDRITRYVTFVMPAASDDNALLRSLPTNMRSNVRRSLKHPFSARQTRELDAFIGLHAGNYRRLGTPCFARKHYAALVKNFGDELDIQEVILEDKVVAASMNLYFRDHVHTFYVASDDRYYEFLPNNYLYFHNIRLAGQGGYRYVDFGRSKKGTGPFEFKRRWGAEMRELPYEILLVRRTTMPNFSPTNPKFGLAIGLWKKLPLWLTRLLGPFLIRLFP